MKSETITPDLTLERKEAKRIYDECYSKFEAFADAKTMSDQEKRVLATMNAIIVVENILRVLYTQCYEINNTTFDFYDNVKKELESKLNYEW